MFSTSVGNWSARKLQRREGLRLQPRLEGLEGRTLLSTAVDFSVAGSHVENHVNIGTLGWILTATKDLTVNKLGLWDDNQDGLGESHQVAIWNAAGTLLGSRLATGRIAR